MNPIKGMTTFSDTVDYHSYDPNLPTVFDEVKSNRHRFSWDVSNSVCLAMRTTYRATQMSQIL